MDREFDIVVFGATGFTGKLVAEYIGRSSDRPRWAIAGRDRGKLEGLGLGVPIIVADAMDPAAMSGVAARTRAIATTVGPYAKYGSALVGACAEAGTHYCDLTGEVPWMRKMIEAHHERAAQTGARIVHTCGFDSIPSDMGTWALQEEMIAQFGAPATKVTAFYGESKGGMSGGTIASGIELAKQAEKDPEVRRIMADPYALDPPLRGDRPSAPDEMRIGWDSGMKMFTMPFLMAAVNTRVVRRSHALAGQPWGADFVYREVMSAPGSVKGALMALGVTGGLAAIAAAMAIPRLRKELEKRAPQPGEGPSAKARAEGYWTLRLVGEGGGHRFVYIAGDEHGDPGYASTAKMLGESALCLALDPLTSKGGVLTPSIAMGGALLKRLQRAGLTFQSG